MKNTKKIISTILAFCMLFSFSPAKSFAAGKGFEDNSVAVVLTIAASRENRTFTVKDFEDVGAVYVKDIDWLSDEEKAFVQPVWEAEKNISTSFSETEQVQYEIRNAYFQARANAEANTMVNFDEYRRVLLIRLNLNCRQNVLSVMRQLQRREYIYTATPNNVLEPFRVIVNDPYSRLPCADANYQWAVQNISLPQAWAISTGSCAVRVGIIGHGIRATHEELTGRVRALSCGRLTDTGWGTAQAGIIGAMGNNGLGIAGIAWNVQLYSVAAGLATIANHAAGVNNARQAGLDILTRSFAGGHARDAALVTAVRNYTGIFINAAGNFNRNTDLDPKFPNLTNVIIVGASDMDNGRSVWGGPETSSCFGRNSVHLFAPGGGDVNGVRRDVRTSHHTNDRSYVFYNGTSSAAPHVAGVAALMLSVNPSLTPLQVRNIIINNVDPIFELAIISVSGGRLNAYKAVRTAATA